MGFLDQATSAVGKVAKIAGVAVAVSKVVTSLGSASGLSSIVDAVSGAFKSFNTVFKQLDGVSLPLANPLHSYASYTYIIGLGILTDDEINDPTASYMGVSRPRLICKSAAMDPNNRVETAYGKFDFFIDNLIDPLKSPRNLFLLKIRIKQKCGNMLFLSDLKGTVKEK